MPNFSHFLWILLLFSPAFIGNSLPVLAQHLPILKHYNKPISSYYFGNHKSYRGFITGSFGGALMGGILSFFPSFQFSFLSGLLLGFSLGFGALFGDLIESFIKRRIGIVPGAALPIWDGIDYICGALLFVLPWYIPTFWDILFLLCIAPVLSLGANFIAYILGLKKVWY